MLSADKSREFAEAARKAVADAAAAEKTATELAAPTQPEETKPPGYYANCPRDEYKAELRRRGFYTNSHGLAG